MTACIVQARLGSTRLPAKVLLPLPTGRTVLEEVLHRCKQIPGVDVVVCAIPDTPENDIVDAIADREFRMVRRGELGFEAVASLQSRKAPYYIVRGPEHDVLARYAKAAEAVNADVIMRITSDCPLIDPEVCGKVLAKRAEDNADYTSNCHPRSWPQGFDCEVFTRGMLDAANRIATDASDREHVTPLMQRLQPAVRSNLSASPDLSHLLWTLDTIEDYTRIWGVIEEQMRAAA